LPKLVGHRDYDLGDKVKTRRGPYPSELELNVKVAKLTQAPSKVPLVSDSTGETHRNATSREISSFLAFHTHRA